MNDPIKFPQQIVIASSNAHKIAEIEAYLSDLPFTLLSLKDFPSAHDIVEDRDSFEGNARKKALDHAGAIGRWVIADDSGLEADALDGRPGVLSARFAGEPADDQRNNDKLLKEMSGVPSSKRTAHFSCVIALANPNEVLFCVEGTSEGIILEEPRGSEGFGYDPLFYYPPLKKTFAELTMQEKSEVSHRGQALCVLVEKFREISL